MTTDTLFANRPVAGALSGQDAQQLASHAANTVSGLGAPGSPIPVTQPYSPPLDEFMPYLEEIWQRKWVTNNGVFHRELEKQLCEYLGVEHLSLFSNGTLALITALQSMKITGEVITTPFSFVATTHALRRR